VTNPWIIYPKPNPQASLRLFCFPYAGAGASIFRTWHSFMTSEIEVCSLQLPGRESRIKEPLFTDLVPLLPALTSALIPHLDRPFIFFGHSVGALFSFEVARRLRHLQKPQPSHLFVSGRDAPQLPVLTPIHQLPDSEFLAELHRYNGTSANVLQHAELMQLFLPILRADLAINENYVYADDTPLNCPISVFGGQDDAIAPPDSLAAWRDHTSSNFSLRIFPGDHFFLKTQTEAISKAIFEDLQQNQQLKQLQKKS
jgi:medium-chain acyl-[acyl-carrier-protein] hydrolase